MCRSLWLDGGGGKAEKRGGGFLENRKAVRRSEQKNSSM